VLLTGSVLLGAVAFLVGFRPFFGPRTAAADRADEGVTRLWLGALALALAGAAAGVMPALFADRIVGMAAMAAGAAPPARTLALWHGPTMPLAMGVAGIAAALLLAWRWRAPERTPSSRPSAIVGSERIYGLALNGLGHVAAWQTRTLQSGSLRHYLRITIAATVVLGGVTVLIFDVPALPTDLARIAAYEAALLLLILASAVAAARSPSRLGAVASLGIVGYGVALLYVIYGAPDLAMTQFVIETLTVILFLFAFRGLPAAAFGARGMGWLRDVTVAGAAGLLMAVLVVAATAVPHEAPISGYFVERSVPDAHGRNVVNVILVDFRALDTLGEIGVLALAGTGVFALLRLRPDTEVTRR
jgi:multicomponent Na+:H+ antiporter subunit A